MERPFEFDAEHYEFQRPEKEDIKYFFRTIHNVEYKVIFKPSPYVFGEDRPYASLLYEFSLLASFFGPDSYRQDDLIAPTVVAIFLDFYNQHDQNICFYICDSSDGKQHVRHRKFTMWFHEYNHGAFVKIDGVLKDTGEISYPVSLILTRDNVYRPELLEAFSDFIERTNNEK